MQRIANYIKQAMFLILLAWSSQGLANNDYCEDQISENRVAQALIQSFGPSFNKCLDKKLDYHRFCSSDIEVERAIESCQTSFSQGQVVSNNSGNLLTKLLFSW